MPHWLEIVIVCVSVSLVWLALLSGIIIKANMVIHRYKVMCDIALEKQKKAQEIINAYGVREMTIGGEENEINKR